MVPFKRMTALDAVSDYSLVVHDRKLEPLEQVGGEPSADRDLMNSCWCQLEGNRDVPEIRRWRPTCRVRPVPLAELTFSRDAADHYVRAVDATVAGRFRLRVPPTRP